ncbi:MAG: hypothetical protein R3A45_11385 [Bdellovibrionota bacterium]
MTRLYGLLQLILDISTINPYIAALTNQGSTTCFSVENIYGQRGQYWYQFDTHANELYELGMNQDYGALPVQALAFINANSFVSWVGPFYGNIFCQ